MNIVIPMAGRGTRFLAYEKPKPLIEVLNTPMVELAVRSLGVHGRYIFIIRDYGNSFTDDLRNCLKSIVIDPVIITIDHVTEGPASSCLLAKEFIDNTPLVIANCDQFMRWNGTNFINYCYASHYDGVIVTYHADTPKNSYALLDDVGDVKRIEEKNVISNVSLNGIHFWKDGTDFISSAESMVAKNIRFNNEFYVGPTYNEMIATGKRVGVFHIPNEQHWAIGCQEDVDKLVDFSRSRHADISYPNRQ